MANPSPPAVEALAAKVPTLAGGWTATDPAIADALNAELVANPAPQGTAKVGYYVTMLVEILGPSSLSNLRAMAGLSSLQGAINNEDDQAVIAWANFLLQSGAIVQAEHDAIVAKVEATQPDPSWTAQVSWPASVIGRAVDAADVAAARAAGGA